MQREKMAFGVRDGWHYRLLGREVVGHVECVEGDEGESGWEVSLSDVAHHDVPAYTVLPTGEIADCTEIPLWPPVTVTDLVSVPSCGRPVEIVEGPAECTHGDLIVEGPVNTVRTELPHAVPRGDFAVELRDADGEVVGYVCRECLLGMVGRCCERLGDLGAGAAKIASAQDHALRLLAEIDRRRDGAQQ